MFDIKILLLRSDIAGSERTRNFLDSFLTCRCFTNADPFCLLESFAELTLTPVLSSAAAAAVAFNGTGDAAETESETAESIKHIGSRHSKGLKLDADDTNMDSGSFAFIRLIIYKRKS